MIEVVPFDGKAGVSERPGHKTGHKPGVQVHDEIKLLSCDRFAQLHELLHRGHQVIRPLRFADRHDVIHFGVELHDFFTGFVGEGRDGGLRIALPIEVGGRDQNRRHVAQAHQANQQDSHQCALCQRIKLGSAVRKEASRRMLRFFLSVAD